MARTWGKATFLRASKTKGASKGDWRRVIRNVGGTGGVRKPSMKVVDDVKIY